MCSSLINLNVQPVNVQYLCNQNIFVLHCFYTIGKLFLKKIQFINLQLSHFLIDQLTLGLTS